MTNDAPSVEESTSLAGPRYVQRGLWFEEFEVGAVYAHRPGRTVTETDNVLFTTLTMNTQPLHLDAAASVDLPPFHERLVNSMFTLSTLVGLSVAQLTQGTVVANLGFTEISFPAPVRHGDTLYAETLVTTKRLSASRPDEGVVTLVHTAGNQHGEVVATATRKTLVRTTPRGDRLGYVPDPLLDHIHRILERPFELLVDRVNPVEAGMHMRLLVRLTGELGG